MDQSLYRADYAGGLCTKICISWVDITTLGSPDNDMDLLRLRPHQNRTQDTLAPVPGGHLMFAIAALVVFILGLILRLLGVGYEWHLLFLGLACFAAHTLWAWTPWTRTP